MPPAEEPEVTGAALALGLEGMGRAGGWGLKLDSLMLLRQTIVDGAAVGTFTSVATDPGDAAGREDDRLDAAFG